MNQPTGVLYLISTWVVGGTETQLLSLLRYIDRDRYQPHVCALYHDTKIGPVMAEVGVAALSLNIRRVRYLDTLPRLMRLADYCRSHNVRVIQGVRTDQLARLVGWMAGVPVVLGGQRDICTGHHLASIRGVFDRRLSGIVANSEAAARHRQGLSGVRPEHFYVVPNGLDLRPFDHSVSLERRVVAPDLPPDAPTLIIVGRLKIETKGHRIVLEALTRPALHDTHLLVAGDGPDRAALEGLINQMGLHGRVHLLGHRADVANILLLSDVAVVASTNESSPNVILEAWAARRPVVATRVGGVPELVEHGANGLLVPPSNPDALAEAAATLLHNPALRNRLAQHGRATVERRYSAQTMAARMADLYDLLLTQQVPARKSVVSSQ